MLSKDGFLRRILEGAPPTTNTESSDDFDSDRLDGFDALEASHHSARDNRDVPFAQLLLEVAGFGQGGSPQPGEVIFANQKPNHFLPPKATYWAKTAERPYHMVHVDLEAKGSTIFSDPAFRQNDQLEDALCWIVEEALEGFERGGEGTAAESNDGTQTQTLCVVSLVDDRRAGPDRQLVCFGTRCQETDALEVFTLHEEARDWDRPLAEEHFEQVFKRHFNPLMQGEKWQEAFISGEQHEKARRLMKICACLLPNEKQLQTAIWDLMDEIAGSFGLQQKGGHGGHRLVMQVLPENHRIAVDLGEERKSGFKNPVSSRYVLDADGHLLGYVVYVLNNPSEARHIRRKLEAHGHLDNVLLVCLEDAGATLELWQGAKSLKGRLKGSTQRSRFDGEGGITQLLSRFFIVHPSRINTPSQLAQALAWRAQHLKVLAIDALHREKANPNDLQPLHELLEVFNQALPTLDPAQLANEYAQTITYGLFAARWLSRDRLNIRFTRQNISRLLPSTTPFLRVLFRQLVNSRVDQGISWLLDDITGLLSRTMVAEVFRGEADPSIHFYQDFLDGYDPQIKKEKGVYYTPEEVVATIVEHADVSVRQDLGLELGLADTTTWADHASISGVRIPDGVDPSAPVVQILDPAVGTGTFLKHTIECIHSRMTERWVEAGQDSAAMSESWVRYVRENLLPRIYGFEVMMAPYVVCHLRLGLVLEQTGFTFSDNDRLQIHLTNALESPPWPQVLISAPVPEKPAFVEDLTSRGHPTVLMGNPPYSSAAGGGTPFSSALLERYMTGLGVERERKKGVLQDDYVRFVAFGEWLLERSGLGVLALVTNNSYLDGTIHRAMRRALLDSFPRADIVDLGGSVRASSTVDENVFNIIQGVSILLATMAPQVSRRWRYTRLEGTREEKLSTLNDGIHAWQTIVPCEPFFLLKPFDTSRYAEYQRFDSLREIFPVNACGIETEKDHFATDVTRTELRSRLQEFISAEHSDGKVAGLFRIKSTPNWDLSHSRRSLRTSGIREDLLIQYLYRPFDHRFTYHSTDIITRPRRKTMDHMLGQNLALLAMRQVKGETFAHVFVTDLISNKFSLSSRSSNVSYHFPLMLRGSVLPQANLSMAFLNALEASTHRRFAVSGSSDGETFTARDVFFYICAVLFSERYRRTYEAYLIKGFPRVPRTCPDPLFRALIGLGKCIVDACLLREAPAEGEAVFHDGGNRALEQVGEAQRSLAQDRSLRINAVSRFLDVPLESWDYVIGGYAPCYKWLADRKRGKRSLSDGDIEHFRRIVAACKALGSLTAEIDRAIEANGGWPLAFEMQT